ncbi:MAG: hypothetical protein M3Y74_08845 [Chloroflexota bacterium]|nr:hypothetical protein [Chloroflexota bacterium]
MSDQRSTHISHHDDKPHARAQRATTAPVRSPSDSVGLLQHMQRTVGNTAVNEMLRHYAAQQDTVAPRAQSPHADLMRAPTGVFGPATEAEAAHATAQAEVDKANAEVDEANRNIGQSLVDHALNLLQTAQSMLAGAIPLAPLVSVQPHMAPVISGIVGPVLGQVQSARAMLDQGLALQGRIQEGAFPGASIDKDGMPQDEGGWKGVRLQLIQIETQLTIPAANPFAAPELVAQLHHQLIMVVVSSRNEIAHEQIAESIKKAMAVPGST